MEAEFVNEFISRLTSNLHDLVSKNIMIETRLAMLEKSFTSLQVEHGKALEELERLKKKATKTAEA